MTRRGNPQAKKKIPRHASDNCLCLHFKRGFFYHIITFFSLLFFLFCWCIVGRTLIHLSFHRCVKTQAPTYNKHSKDDCFVDGTAARRLGVARTLALNNLSGVWSKSTWEQIKVSEQTERFPRKGKRSLSMATTTTTTKSVIDSVFFLLIYRNLQKTEFITPPPSSGETFHWFLFSPQHLLKTNAQIHPLKTGSCLNSG